MSLSPIPYKTEPGAKGTKQYLRSFSDLYERLATEGLVTPSSIDVEQSVLGAMLIDKSTVNKVLEIIGQRTQENSPFYRDAHTVIYQAMQKLDADRLEIDLILLTNQLRFDGKLELVGGPSYISNKFTHEIYGVGITILAIIFSVYFAALAVIMSSSDNEFLKFFEEIRGFSRLIASFKFSLSILFVALLYSFVLDILSSYWIDKNSWGQSITLFAIFVFLFFYSVLAAATSILDCIKFAQKRSEFIGLRYPDLTRGGLMFKKAQTEQDSGIQEKLGV